MFSSSEFFRKLGEWVGSQRTGVLHFWVLQSFLHRAIRTVAKMMDKHKDMPVTVTRLLLAFWPSSEGYSGVMGTGLVAEMKEVTLLNRCQFTRYFPKYKTHETKGKKLFSIIA